MDKKNIALIGAGGIGKIWAKAFLKTQGATLAAIADTDKARAEEIAKDFPGCTVTTDWKTLLADPNIYGVVVATPHFLLAPISKAFLEAKKHVLSEKPGGVNPEEVKTNTQIAEKNGVVYMIGFIHRFHPSFIEAKKLIGEGKIGKVICVRARHGFGGRPGYEKEWRFTKSVSGGGELIDQGMHLLDLSRWFMGEFQDIRGFAENLFWGGEVEDNGFVLLRTKDRRVASVHVSWTNWDWIHSFEIFGDKGYLDIEGLDQRYKGPEKLIVGEHNPREAGFPKETVIVYDKEGKDDSFSRELGAFLGAVDGNIKDYPSGNDAYEALKIVESVYKKNG